MQFGSLIVTLHIFGLANLFGSDAAPSPYGYRRRYDYRHEKRGLCDCTTNSGKGLYNEITKDMIEGLMEGDNNPCSNSFIYCGFTSPAGVCCIPPPPPLFLPRAHYRPEVLSTNSPSKDIKRQW